LEFGIYRDGDNNLDRSQSAVIRQARIVSAEDTAVQFTVEDTSGGTFGSAATRRTTIQDGGESPDGTPSSLDDMASPKNLANFVARTLDNAERVGAKQTWIELVDHGAGDGGGLEADSFHEIMPMPQIAQAIADGVNLHATAHPEDAGRTVDGVVANQCLMASLGFADALSHAGVRWLAASPETMVSPGVPSSVADAVAKAGNPKAMGAAIVRDVMQQSYGAGTFAWKPAAAFDVLDLDPRKRTSIERNVKAFNDAVAARSADGATVAALRGDARSVRGMVRFSDATPDMPWHADRPALALYAKIASDDRLDAQLRGAAAGAASSIRAIVTAHAESSSFEPFGGSDYRDAAGPTVHFPVTKPSVDPWAPRVTETHNRFFTETDAAAAERVLA
jgi:hypothetical protein